MAVNHQSDRLIALTCRGYDLCRDLDVDVSANPTGVVAVRHIMDPGPECRDTRMDAQVIVKNERVAAYA